MLLTVAVVTLVWVLVESLVGWFLHRASGRRYRIPVVVLHIFLFLFVVTGWVFTVNPALLHAGSWIAEALMASGLVAVLISGLRLTAGRETPAPASLLRAHDIGVAVAILGSLAGIACILLGL